MNVQLINEMVKQKYITVHKHPDFDLYIYNYSKQASAERVWNEATELCRGLILDKDMDIVARPFTKFYNYEELVEQHIEIPDLPFEVYEKLDGSLGILYFADGKPYIATRGSFESDQAKHATGILYAKYADVIDQLDQNKTYLFEIIYNDPKARANLVVDYGDTDDIFLLAVIHTQTGDEDDIADYAHLFKTAQRYDSVKDYLQFRNDQNGKNREGFVIKFANNFRMKLKFAEYFKAHCAQNKLNLHAVFDAVINGKDNDLRVSIENNLSEESLIYFDAVVDDIHAKYDAIVQQCKDDYRDDFVSRADAAKYFMQCKYPNILFGMMDGKEVSKFVWKLVEKELV